MTDQYKTMVVGGTTKAEAARDEANERRQASRNCRAERQIYEALKFKAANPGADGLTAMRIGTEIADALYPEDDSNA